MSLKCRKVYKRWYKIRLARDLSRNAKSIKMYSRRIETGKLVGKRVKILEKMGIARMTLLRSSEPETPTTLASSAMPKILATRTRSAVSSAQA